MPAGNWTTWLILAGRGWGKTRTGAEAVRQAVKDGRRRIALVAPTAADGRDVMVEGESGLLSVGPESERPNYEPSKRRLTWPNGAIATIYSAEDPDQLRGPGHDFAWCDELAAWKRPHETWDMLLFGLRQGTNPQAVVTTTPRPIKEIRDLLLDPTCVVTRGSTYENRANLAPAFFSQIVRRYEGTRLGRQELEAEVLSDTPGALWKLDLIDLSRVAGHPELIRVVVGVDPAASSNDSSDETGIVVAGIGVDGHGYVLDDVTLRGTPGEWAGAAVRAYRATQADRIVGEVNNGGEMVGFTILTVDPNVSYKAVHASRGKQTRAEPIASLYEQGRIHHVGTLPALEDQMTTWIPGMRSPDRMDALVWALTELFLEAEEAEEDIVLYEDRVSISRF